jgi:lipocalin
VWYEQVNSKAFVIDANLQCVTAEYSANDDGTVKVLNKGAQNSPTETSPLLRAKQQLKI